MNKRITSLMLCFVMVLSLLVTAVPALAAPIESTQLKVTADKTSAKPGDTITYTITMGPVSDMGSMQMCLDIPTGLTYVENSTELADGLKATLGFDDVAWTEISKMINGVASAADYESNTDTVIAEFKCTVDADFSGTAEVGLTNLEFGSCQTFEYHTDRFSVVKASVTVTVPHTHVYDQTDTDAAHLKTPATCTRPAVYYKSCTCGENGTETFTSGSALGHDYTKKVENNTYLKTAASNCTEYNVYWYACSRCDANAKDDAAATDKYYTSTTAGNHSFTEKIEDAAHYVAGTGTDCQSVKQYYYDCAYCDQIGTTTWDSTTYGEHTEGTEWKFDENNHWHICTVAGCGVVIESSKAAHTPGPAATETTPQKCTVCDYVIAPALGHTHNITPVSEVPATCTTNGTKAHYKCSGCEKLFEDAAGNVEITDTSALVIKALNHDWEDATCTAPKTCKRAGCGATEGNALGHDWADATCTAPKTCKRAGCGATEGEALGHDWAAATCTAPKTCKRAGCGATEGEALGHTEGTEWKSDKDNHWHTCTVAGCGVVIESSKAAHTPDREAATETDPIKCTECGYEIAPALGMSDYILEMPVMVGVKLTGDEKPGKETFKFEIYDLGVEDAEFEILNDTVVAENLTFDENGVAFIEGMLKIKVTGSAQLFNLTEGFKVRMVKGSAKGWTYATEQWNVTPVIFEGTTDADFNIGFDVREIVDGVESEIPANGMSFSVSYEAVTEPGTPKTGDSSNMLLWAALLLAGGLGTFGTVAYSKKRKEDAE